MHGRRARLPTAGKSPISRPTPLARSLLLWKRVIKQESVNHRARVFNGLILERDEYPRLGWDEEKSATFLYPAEWRSRVLPLVSSLRLININLVDGG